MSDRNGQSSKHEWRLDGPECLNRELCEYLLGISGPSGAESSVQTAVFSYLEQYADQIQTDVHGNVIGAFHPEGRPRILLAGHSDQVGMVVKYIDPDGFLFLDPLGGPDEATLPGASVVVHTRSGAVPGVVGKRAVHLETKKQKDTVPTFSDIWVDIGAKDKKDAEKYIETGDYVSFEPRVRWLKNRILTAPSLDNRAGLFVALETFRICAQKKIKPALFVASTVQEEMGMRGAVTAALEVRPEIAIAIDVTNASDDPGKKPKNPECALGKGPGISRGPNTNPVLYRRILEAAEAKGIPHQILPCGDLEGNDAKVLQVASGPAATISIGIPNRNMHTPAEICHWEDIENAVRLLVEFIGSVGSEADFRPLQKNFSKKEVRTMAERKKQERKQEKRQDRRQEKDRKEEKREERNEER